MRLSYLSVFSPEDFLSIRHQYSVTIGGPAYFVTSGCAIGAFVIGALVFTSLRRAQAGFEPERVLASRVLTGPAAERTRLERL